MADLDRRSPSARLYSEVPRSSQWPSMSTSWLGLALRWAALASSTLASAGRMSALSKAKKICLSASLARYSFGGAGGGGVGAATGGGVGAGAGAGGGGAGAGGAAAGGGTGGGALACVIWGRFGQPARKRVSERIGTTAARDLNCRFIRLVSSGVG